MFRTLKRSYNGGWRAGRCGLIFVECEDGLKRPQPREHFCPYHQRKQFLQRFFWNLGYDAGFYECVTRRIPV